MLPSIDIRIQNLVKALQQVILPAVDPSNKLAVEQAQLAIAHLHVIAQQWDQAHQFEIGSLRAMRQLADSLIAASAGGVQTTACAKQVEAVVGRIDPAALLTANSIAVVIGALGSAIDALIFAISADGSETCRDASRDAILEYSLRQARRERVWFAGTGLDPDRAALPSFSMIAQ